MPRTLDLQTLILGAAFGKANSEADEAKVSMPYRTLSSALNLVPAANIKAPKYPTYFLLADFREIGQQPPDTIRFTSKFVDFHKKSVSPTGEFRFHITIYHWQGSPIDISLGRLLGIAVSETAGTNT